MLNVSYSSSDIAVRSDAEEMCKIMDESSSSDSMCALEKEFEDLEKEILRL